MADTDPGATLHALASHFRDCAEYCATGGSNANKFLALAEHVEGVAERSAPAEDPDGCGCVYCVDVAELVAVAAAAGVTP